MTTLTRRRFLQGTAAACAGGTVLAALQPQLAFAADAGSAGDTLVLIVLRGGMDGLSALVPVGDGGSYYDRRPSVAVPAAAVVPLNGQFGMHPAMQPLLAAFQQGNLAFVPAAGSPDPSRSHFNQQDMLERGTDSGAIASGWVARHLNSSSNTGALRGVALGTNSPTSLSGADSSMALANLATLVQAAANTGDLASGGAVLSRLSGGDQIGSAADATVSAVRALQGIEISAAATRNGATYPNSLFAGQLRDVARIAQSGIGLDAAVLSLGGWDLHAGMGSVDQGPMRDRLAMLAGALAAFQADTTGLSRPVTTVVASEFGRRVAQNGSGGTDHGRGGLVLAMGDGIQGGVYGSWPGLSADVLDRGDVPVTTDFRDVVAEIVQQRLGNPALDVVFPGFAPSFLGLTRA